MTANVFFTYYFLHYYSKFLSLISTDPSNVQVDAGRKQPLKNSSIDWKPFPEKCVIAVRTNIILFSIICGMKCSQSRCPHIFSHIIYYAAYISTPWSRFAQFCLLPALSVILCLSNPAKSLTRSHLLSLSPSPSFFSPL